MDLLALWPLLQNITGKYSESFIMIYASMKCKKYHPDLFLSPGSPYAAHVSRLFGKPHLAYIDTEIAIFAIKLMLPLPIESIHLQVLY